MLPTVFTLMITLVEDLIMETATLKLHFGYLLIAFLLLHINGLQILLWFTIFSLPEARSMFSKIDAATETCTFYSGNYESLVKHKYRATNLSLKSEPQKSSCM